MSKSIKYPINNVYPCLQGEGVQTGIPMILVRLQGCDVGCPFCDTKETWKLNPKMQSETQWRGANPHWRYFDADSLASLVQNESQGIKWVLLTGGEPSLYPLTGLVNTLHERGFKVALETSGTASGCVNANIDWLCVSPKENMPGERPLLTEVIKQADEIKYVIGKQRDIERLYALLSNYSTKKEVVICLQPMSQSKKATALCVEMCLKNQWRLSLQIHKYLMLP